MDLHASNSEERLYTFYNKIVDQNYFTTAESRNYCLGLPDWCPCIDCTAKTTSSSTGTIIDDEPDEVTQCKNAEMVYSKQLDSRSLSLNRRRKCVPSEDCSENPAAAAAAAAAAATGIKKPQKCTAGHVPEERFSFNIGEDDLETFKKGEFPANTTKSTEWAMKNFELWLIAHNAKFRDQCPEHWFEDKEKLCGWLCTFVAETQKADEGEYTPRSIPAPCRSTVENTSNKS